MKYKEKKTLLCIVLLNLTLLLVGKWRVDAEMAYVYQQYADLEQHVIKIESLIYDDEEEVKE